MIRFRILKWTLRILGVLLLMIVLYVGSVFVLSYIPVNSDFEPCDVKCVEIYLLSNGVHTDLVLPIRNKHKDWSEAIPFEHILSKDSLMRYIAFGWGDRQFYLETPTWAELKFGTAVKALFVPSSAAMHVTFYKYMAENENCKKVSISYLEYNKMIRYIEDSFRSNKEGGFTLIRNLSYGDDDCFYEANGKFHLFYTCNTWTNNGLKHSGLKASVWTPFDGAILDHYRTIGLKE